VRDLSFSALPLTQIDFEIVEVGVKSYNEMIKLRLGFINRHENSNVDIAEFESICLQVRKIIENFAHYYTFLFQETTDASLSEKKAIREYNAEQIMKYMIGSGYVALISPFGNDRMLQDAGMISRTGDREIITFRFYQQLYNQLGKWLHEPTRLERTRRDPTQFAEDLYKKIRKIEASLWRHIVPSEEFSIVVNYGGKDTKQVSVFFNDLRPATMNRPAPQ
jgi:hypothetical protein